MSITGVTLIRGGYELNYPFELCIRSMLTCCDEVIVNCDPSVKDGTFEKLCNMLYIENLPITIAPRYWDMSNTGDGSMLAKQANECLEFVRTDWVLYLQADELIHEKDAYFIKNCVSLTPPYVPQIEFLRTYFWGSLTTRYKPNEIYLGRLFRTGTHTIGGDGMYIKPNSNSMGSEVYRTERLIYHYSRMGSEEQITKRIRNLDKLFHPEDEVNTYKPFKYNEVDESDFINYNGTHPAGIEKLYV